MDKRRGEKAMRIIMIAICALFAGCASIVSSSNYDVELTSKIPSATVAIKKDGEQVFRGITPTIATLPASNGYFTRAKYEVVFTKDNYKESINIGSSIDPWYFGNIVFGGLIGIIAVDPLTGAMWKLPAKVTDKEE